MPSLSLNARFLGVDLGALWLDTRRAWARVAESPVLSWLSPQPQVVLLRADGSEAFWVGDAAFAEPAARLKASFTALELPEDYVLRRSLDLPRLASSDLDGALALQAKAISPFPPEDLVWGSAVLPNGAGNGHRVEIALASRRQVAQYAATQAARLGAISDYEVWAQGIGHVPVVIRGFGESARSGYGKRVRHAGYALLALIGILLLAVAATPTLQLYMRASQAAVAFQELAQRAAPQVRQREEMMQSIEKLKALSDSVTERLEPLRVLDMLTQVLPDDTAIQNFKLQGRKVTLSGVTANSSSLMQLLGEQPGLRDVKAPSPATRLGASTNETYVIEFMLDPRVFGVVVPAGGGKVVAPAPAAAAAAAPAPAPAAGASAPAVVSGVAGSGATAGTPTAASPASVASAPMAGASLSNRAPAPSSASSPASTSNPASAPVAPAASGGKASFGGASFGGGATPPAPRNPS
ncbi:MAG: fimbrial assembly protein [Comamonadaceae bacterium]|nr:MAG: fimbrial assembly protein [Comamonadaceae bacterium]